MAKKNNHTHQYVREKLGKQLIYRCILPDCSHYILARLVLGRKSLCNYCGAEFVIDKHNSTLRKPHCNECVVVHNAKPKPVLIKPSIQDANIESFLSQLDQMNQQEK